MPEIRKYQWGGGAIFNNPLFANLPFANMVGPTGNSSDGKANPLAGIQSFLGFTPSSNSVAAVQETQGAGGTSGNLVPQDQVQAAVPGQASLAGGGIGSIINAGKNFKSLAGAMKDAKAAGEGLKGLRTNIAGNAIGMVGNVLGMASSFIPGLEDQYAGPKGDLTQTLDGAYDNVSNTLMAIPGIGMIAGGAMKVGGFIGDILDSAGIGTDKMTTKDAILDSNFLKLTPFGLINALGAKKTQTLTKDNEAFEQVGSSYGGTSQAVDDALKVAGKKYGAFSGKERREANSEISEARRQQMQMAAIADNAADRFAITDSMAAINNNRRALALQGGYNQSAVRVGKQGMQLPIIKRAKQILYNIGQIENSSKLQDGGKVKSRTLQELIEYAKKENPRFIQRMSEPLKYVEWNDDRGHHFGTHEMSYGEADGRYFVYPRIQEIDGNLVRYQNDQEAMQNALKNHNILWVNNEDEAKLFTESEELPNGTFKGYKAGGPEFFNQKPVKYKEGGSINVIPTEIELVSFDTIESFKQGGSTEIELVSLDDIQEYKEGGSINVIPEGALHARLHHMDMDGITKKGIPVVDNNGVQQAEIEHSEIIFRIEVTKKLEELQKKYYSEEYSDKEKDKFALEAGQLLVDEVLHNTDDRTNLINQVE